MIRIPNASRWLAACLVAFSLHGCGTTQSVTRPGATGVQAKSIMLVDAAQLDAQAEVLYRSMLDEARSQGRLNTDRATVDKLRRIGAKLIEHVAVFRDDAPHWEWDINLIHSGDLNAFCMPGGKIAFFSGIIDRLRLTDDEIAAIMGHEIAHALREHARARASRALWSDVGALVLGTVTGADSGAMEQIQQARQLFLQLPHSRGHESEADILGLELAARAGFDPHGAIRVWEKMSAQGGARVPEFQSTHPSHGTRIGNIRRHLHLVEPLYARGAGSPPPRVGPDKSAAAASIRTQAIETQHQSFRDALRKIQTMREKETTK